MLQPPIIVGTAFFMHGQFNVIFQKQIINLKPNAETAYNTPGFRCGFGIEWHPRKNPRLRTGGCVCLLRQLREELVDMVDEALGLGFICGSLALVVLEVAQGGLGISLRTE